MDVLPMKIVDTILEKIPLQETIPLRLVCRDWKSSVDAICQNKWSLKLFGSRADLDDYIEDLTIYNLRDDPQFLVETQTNDVLIFPDFALQYEDACLFLIRLFPNILKLTVSCQHYQVHLTCLLSRMVNLNWLALFNVFQIGKTRKTSIWPLLNAMPLLESLHLFFVEKTFIPIANISPTLSRLVYFSLVDYDSSYEFSMKSALKALGFNLKYLRLNGVNYDNQTRGNELSTSLGYLNPKVKANLINLSVANLQFDDRDIVPHEAMAILDNICTNLSSLEYFDPEFSSNVPFNQQIHALSKLPFLSTLRLQLNLSQLMFNENSFDDPKLHSVKTLKLKIYPDDVLTSEENRNEANNDNNSQKKNTKTKTKVATFPMKKFPIWINSYFPKLEQLYLETVYKDLAEQLRQLKSSFVYLRSFKADLF